MGRAPRYKAQGMGEESTDSGTVSQFIRLIDSLQTRTRTSIVAFLFCGISLLIDLSLQKFSCSGIGLGFISLLPLRNLQLNFRQYPQDQWMGNCEIIPEMRGLHSVSY